MIRWVGKTNERVGRGGSLVDMSETRWIVPVKPYEPPRGSMEKAENVILMGAAVLALLFSFAILIYSAL